MFRLAFRAGAAMTICRSRSRNILPSAPMNCGRGQVSRRRRSRRLAGNLAMLALIEERSREAWHWPTAESILADVRFALRQLMQARRALRRRR